MLGTGLLSGLGVTAKNFVGSFHDPARLTTIESAIKPFTIAVAVITTEKKARLRGW